MYLLRPAAVTLMITVFAMRVSAQWETLIPDSFITALWVSGDTVIAGSTTGMVRFSDDAGATWTSIDAGLPNGYVTEIERSRNGRFFCAVQSQLFWSEDLVSWSLANSFGSGITCLATAGDTILCGAEFNGGLHASLNNGSSWSMISSGLLVQYATSVVMHGGSIYFSAFGQDLIHRTNDMGNTWTPVINGLSNASVFYLYSDGDLYAGAINAMYKLVGGSWQSFPALTIDQYLDVDSEGDVLTVNGGDGRITFSSDAGATWYTSSIPDATCCGVSVVGVSGAFIYAGGMGLHRFSKEIWSGIDPTGTRNEALSAWPNPTNASCRITLNEPIQQAAQISISDLHGRTQGSVPFIANKTEVQLDLSSVAPGVYAIRVVNGSRAEMVNVVVIR
jgi:hypothetical protein